MTIVNILVGILCVLSSMFLIVFVLLHSGRGSGLSDMFGGGGALQGGTVMERNLDRLTIATALAWTFSVVFLGLQLT
ncbi:MAG: preprotein translocase subunit SecG [Acidimicrobiia bacterium]|nr:preprotein translocase subunit SecG [Acidimicrobiia bacterium]